MTPLETQLNKVPLPGMDYDFFFERLSTYPEGEWFSPTNKDNEDYSICDDLYTFNLIQKTSFPIWAGGGFRGLRTFFKYSLDLKYDMTEAA